MKTKKVKCYECKGSGRFSWSDDSYSQGSCACDKCYGTGYREIIVEPKKKKVKK